MSLTDFITRLFENTFDAISLNLMVTAVMLVITLWDLAGFRIDTKVPQRLCLRHIYHIFDWREARLLLTSEAKPSGWLLF